MSDDLITMDKIMHMLDEASGFKLDASQRDSIRIVLEDYAARLAEDYGATPAQLAEAHLNSLHALAVQLLDTGTVRSDGNIATKDDLKAVAASITKLAHQVIMPAPKLEVDLSPIVDRLEALSLNVTTLTSTVLATQGQHSGEITTMAGDLAEINDEMARISMMVSAMPDAYIPLQRVTPEEFVTQQLSVGNGLSLDPDPEPQEQLAPWEQELLAEGARRQAAIDDAIGIIAGINEADRKSARKGMRTQAKNNPGCFFNEDGTITCRICGIAKDPDDFHKDKQARTGRRSKCAQCDHDTLMAAKS